MSTRYWVYKNSHIMGPVGADVLARSGHYGPDTLVCPEHARGEEEGDWRCLDEVPELSGLVPAGAAPLARPPESSLPEAPRFHALAGPESEDWLSEFFAPARAGRAPSDTGELAAAQARIKELTERIETLSKLVARFETQVAPEPRTRTEPPPIPALEARALPTFTAPAVSVKPFEDPAALEEENIKAPPLPEPAIPETPPPPPPPPPPAAQASPAPRAEPAPPDAPRTMERTGGEPWKPSSAPTTRSSLRFGTAKSFPTIRKETPTSSTGPTPAAPPAPGPVPAASEPPRVEPPPAPEAPKPSPFEWNAPASAAPAPLSLQAPPPAASFAPPPAAPAPSAAPTASPPAASPFLAPAPRPAPAPPPTPGPSAGGPPPLTMVFSPGGAPTAPGGLLSASPAEALPGAPPPAATQEVLARLAKPKPPAKTEAPRSKRSQKTFIIVITAALLGLAAMVFLFLRNPKDIKTAVTMGEDAAPLGAEPSEELSAQARARQPASEPASGSAEAPLSTAPPEAAPTPPEPGKTQQAGPVFEPSRAPVEPQSASERVVSEARQEAAAVKDTVQAQREAAIALVKRYPLDGGRGTVAQWLQYSFTANPGDAGGEKWDAGAVEASTYLVQYTVQPGGKKLPQAISYLFEADVARKTVRGHNKQAQDLLAGTLGPRDAKPSAARPAKKPAKKRVARKPTAAKTVPQLPLPSDRDLAPPSASDAHFTEDTVQPDL